MTNQKPYYKDFMHPGFVKAIETIETKQRPAQFIWMNTTNDELKRMLDLVSYYVANGEFEIPSNGKFDYGQDKYSLDHFYKD